MIESWDRAPGVVLRLLLLRHGEPERSAEGRCYGKLDVGLSERGKRQAARAAALQSLTSIDAVYSSPRLRAQETASVLSSASGLETRVDCRLSEIDFGVLEGLSYDAARELYPELYTQWMARPTEVEFPGGESFSRMRSRVLQALFEIRARHVEATVALVSHGGVNRIVLGEALGLPSEHVFRLGQSYGAVSVVDYLEESAIVVLVNGALGC